MRYISSAKGLAIMSLALILAACGSAPKQVLETPGDEAPAARADRGEPPPGFPAGAPDTNPYLAQSAKVPADARDQFQAAVNAMQAEDWQKAEVLLQQLTAEYPELSGPFLNLGIVCHQLGDDTRAETALRQSLTVNPLNLDAYNQLGLLMREQGRFEEAEESYLSALKVWPKHADSHRNIGILYDLYLGQLDKALQHFEIYQYLQPEPDNQVTGWIIDLKRRLNSPPQNPAA